MFIFSPYFKIWSRTIIRLGGNISNVPPSTYR